jgi:hypothetical protein
MNDEQLLEQLRENGFFLKDGRCNPKALCKLNNHPSLSCHLKSRLNFLPDDASFSQMVHALKNHLTSVPSCPVCNNNIKFDKPSSSYPITCSPKCGAEFSPNKTFKLIDVTKDPRILKRRIDSRKRNYRTGDRAVLTNTEWLYNKHTVRKYSITEIAKEVGVTPQTVKNALIEFDIQSPPPQELREASNIRKYGVKNPGLLPEVREKARKSEYANKVGGWKSKGEKQILTFIQSLLPTTPIHENTQRVISPYELDIYVPEYNLAIEYCGLYWHSDKFKENYYHRNKLHACQQKGISLLTIFEDEWLDKRHIIEAKIKSILNLDDRETVFARNTRVVNVSKRTKKEFFEQYHIQGTGAGSITYALIDQSNTPVAMMTFIKRAPTSYELNRYATSKRVVGGFSKLLKHFQQNNQWDEIVSFADLRISDGNLYEKTGWIKDKVLYPDYYWCKSGERFHKFGFRHKFLPQVLEHYDPTLSENENCKANGYHKIYNCGLIRYKLINVDCQ